MYTHTYGIYLTNSIKHVNKSRSICRTMLTTDGKLLVNNMMELLSVCAGEKSIDIFDNENVEHIIYTYITHLTNPL